MLGILHRSLPEKIIKLIRAIGKALAAVHAFFFI